jgi:hypothetical protein
MKKLLLLLLPLTVFGQKNLVDEKFQDMSWIIDEKCSEIFSELSSKYRDDELLNDSNFVLEDRYNMYYDSLSLWYMTGEYTEDNSPIIKGEEEFIEAEKYHSISFFLKNYEASFISELKKNNYNTSLSNMCIPSNYEHIYYVKKYEFNRVKSFNNGRILYYNYYLEHRDTEVNIELYFHKTILPYDSHGAKYYPNGWIPFSYYYEKPKVKVYKATHKKLWESKTGLPYSLLKELNVDSNRIESILENFELLPKVILNTNKIYVSCDTCNVRLFDSQMQDGDIVEFDYGFKKIIELNKTGETYDVILKDNHIFKLTGISKGLIDLCTVDLIIDKKKYTFELENLQEEYIELIKY